MQRREALRLLAGAAALPLLSRDAFSLFREVHEQLAEAPARKTLNPHQNATVTAISELIIPQTETPGAKAVRVNEFIDLILTEWYDDDERQRFLAGLADVDVRSRDVCGKDFVDGSEKQQLQIVSSLDEELAGIRQPLDLHRQGRFAPTEKQFFYMMKRLTLVGYYTSQAGFEQELHQQIIPPSHPGCAPIEEEAT
jgi:Gluconate 2-dehydrogenase subunit 3